MADKEKQKNHVKIGVVGHVGYGRTSLNLAIAEVLANNPQICSWIDPIDSSKVSDNVESIQKSLTEQIVDLPKDEPEGPQMG